QRAWADLEYDPEIAKPTIIFQGLRDRSLHPSSAITYAQGIVDAGKANLYRHYMVKDMGHSPPDPPAVPQSLTVDAILKLDAWVKNGTEPGPLDVTFTQVGFPPIQIFQPSCAKLEPGFGQDPLGCFCKVLETGVGGFCSLDSNTVCSTNNPVTTANEDNCVPAGKGTCVAVIPDECSS